MERWDKIGLGHSNNTRIVILVIGSALLLVLGAALQVLYAEVNVKARVADLKSSNAKTRAQAALALAKERKTEASADIAAAFRAEKDEIAKARMIHALAALGNREAAADIRRSAESDPSANVRGAGCLSLGLMNDAAAVPALTRVLLNDREDDSVRASAASALTFYLADPAARQALEKILAGNNRVVKFGLVNALRHTTKTPQGQSLLGIAAKDADPDVRSLAENLKKG